MASGLILILLAATVAAAQPDFIDDCVDLDVACKYLKPKTLVTDGCNKCRCAKNGIGICTLIGCRLTQAACDRVIKTLDGEIVKQNPGQSCVPDTKALCKKLSEKKKVRFNDGCNDCWCNEDDATCTYKACSWPGLKKCSKKMRKWGMTRYSSD